MSRSAGRQLGRTLIELLVAMAIGLAILAGVGALYVSSSGVSRVATQAGTAEDLGRVAMFAIGESIKMAGYGEIAGSDTQLRDQTMFDGAAIRGCSGSRFTNPFATPPDYTCTGAAPGDQLLLRFQGRYALIPNLLPAELNATEIPDCIGGAGVDTVIGTGGVARPGQGANVRIVENIFNANAAGDTLMCTGNSSGVPNALIPNVIDFSVFYRFDDDGYAAKVAGDHRYSPLGGSVRDATFINGLALINPVDPWKHVVGAIVCITIASADRGTSVQTTNLAATRCPRTAAEAATGTTQTEISTDGRMRRTFMQVFNVRSQGTPIPSVDF